jgi:5-methylcytosine-specific restriction endonuclease McrA
MRVFVINKHGEVLMPCSPRKAKILLKSGRATVIKRNPFTLQLKYGSAGYRQPITLGIDTGHKEVGISAVSETKEVFSAVATMRNDISDKMTTRKMYRRQRRNKLRYRAPRFLNRSSSKRKGRLAPSVQWKVDAHIKLINQLKSLLPITKVVLETGKFDMAKMNNPDITNKQYQQGVQYSFENIKAYVLARDSYQCQSGKKGCCEKRHVHHIVFRSKGGTDKATNLITLCEKHHQSLHAGKWSLSVVKQKTLKSATTMNIIRSKLLNIFPDAIETFGYITKANRYHHSIVKSHSNDAFVIAGGTSQSRESEREITFKRKNNRSLQKNRNGFAPSIRKQRYAIQPLDIIEWKGVKCIAKGMQNKGAYLAFMDGTKRLVKNMKTITLIFQNKGIIYA